MPAPVSLVTVHHEGAGSPSDIAHGAFGGYSVWIGASNYTVLRSPWESFATYHYNHVSLDICLSGNRHKYSVWQRIKGILTLTPVTAYKVTDNDIALIRAACADARARGWVIGNPLVRFHHDSPGSSTVCPGNNTDARAPEVVNACTDDPAPPPPPPPPSEDKVKPMFSPPLGPIAAVWEEEVTLFGERHKVVLAAVSPFGDVYAWGVKYRPWPTKDVDFAGRIAARIGQAEGQPKGHYTITATSGEKYTP